MTKMRTHSSGITYGEYSKHVESMRRLREHYAIRISIFSADMPSGGVFIDEGIGAYARYHISLASDESIRLIRELPTGSEEILRLSRHDYYKARIYLKDSQERLTLYGEAE